MPLTSNGDDWYLKVLINNENVFIRMDVWPACHECPPSWVRCLSPESVERRATPESTTITKTRKDLDVKNSSSPRANWSCGQTPQLFECWKTLMSWCLRNPGVTMRTQPSRRWKRRTLPLRRRISPCYYFEMRRWRVFRSNIELEPRVEEVRQLHLQKDSAKARVSQDVTDQQR